jgi:hypothetical protein
MAKRLTMIGAGPAGYVAALDAVAAGLEVRLIDNPGPRPHVPTARLHCHQDADRWAPGNGNVSRDQTVRHRSGRQRYSKLARPAATHR